MRKVYKGRRYRYFPASWDLWDARTNLRAGDVVTVIHCQGCPPPGAMGHAHVNDSEGKFAGLVSIRSLQPLKVKK